MFILTGEFKGEAVQDRVTTADELINLFGLKNIADFGQKQLYFVVDESQYSKHPDGTKAVVANRRVAPVVEGIFNGVNYSIRYYSSMSRKPIGKDIQINYKPDRVQFRGTANAFVLPDAKELAVFWLLYKGTEQSPFRHARSGRPILKYQNTRVNEQVKFEAAERLTQLRSKILSLDDSLAIFYAKGFRKGNYTISRDRCETALGAKVALLEALEKFPTEFGDIVESASTYMLGVVMDLIDTDKIGQEFIGGGQTKFFWKDNDDEIFRSSGDFMANFYAYVQDPMVFRDIARRAKLSPEVNRSPESGTNVEILAKAKAENKITVIDGKAYLVTNGKPDDRALLTIKGDDWEGEVLASEATMRKIKNHIG